MNARYFTYLSLGLTRKHVPDRDRERGREHRKHGKKFKGSEKMVEPKGAISCRRRIVLLSAPLILAGFAGIDPHALSPLGVSLSGVREVVVLGFAAVFAHLYWYWLRYQYMKEDGVFEQDPTFRAPGAETVKVSERFTLVRREADLFSNWAACALTLLSWFFIARWVIDALAL